MLSRFVRKKTRNTEEATHRPLSDVGRPLKRVERSGILAVSESIERFLAPQIVITQKTPVFSARPLF